MFDVKEFPPRDGRLIKEDNSTVNEGDFIGDVWDQANHCIRTSGGSSSAVSNEYYGLSTDTKPTAGVPEGASFYELNTGNGFVFDGVSTWYPV